MTQGKPSDTRFVLAQCQWSNKRRTYEITTSQGYFRGARITRLTLSKHQQLFTQTPPHRLAWRFSSSVISAGSGYSTHSTSHIVSSQSPSSAVQYVRFPFALLSARQPPIILKPVHDPEKSSTSSAFTNPTTLLSSNAAPV